MKQDWHTIILIMFPEDRVLVAYLPDPQDFTLIQEAGWYRIPMRFAPKGLHAEYVAFYFGSKFAEQKWAIHYYARNLGHELTTRRALLPAQQDHQRADDIYYKIQLGPLQRLPEPIMSLRWRRLTFIHTTWDRFQDAAEINDLFVDGDPYVDRLYATLKERGVQAERNYRVKEAPADYYLPLAVPCRDGDVQITNASVLENAAQIDAFAGRIIDETMDLGGVIEVHVQKPANEQVTDDDPN